MYIMQQGRLHILDELFKTSDWPNQESLLLALEKRGIQTTQATLSRDLEVLGIVKINGVYTKKSLSTGLDGFIQILSCTFVSPNLFVIKTSPGLAQAAARLIDESSLKGIAGTIAGDDTIFVALQSAQQKTQLQKNLVQLFNNTRARRRATTRD